MAPTIEAMMAPDDRMRKALMHLVLHKPFWGSLIMRLKVYRSHTVQTIATDGRRLVYNPKWIGEQQFEHLITILAHEVGHCMFGHPFRRGNRDAELYNIAGDHVVNLILLEDGEFKFPSHATMDKRFKGMNIEQVYSILESERPKQGGGQGDDDEEGEQQQQQAQPGGDSDDAQGEQAQSDQQSEGEGEGGTSDDAQPTDAPSKDKSEPGKGEGSDAAEDAESEEPEQEGDAPEEPGQGDPEAGGENDDPEQQPGEGSDAEHREGKGSNLPPEANDEALSEAPGTQMGDVLDSTVQDAETGEVRDADESEMTSQAEAWATAAASAAMQADAAGHLSANAVRTIRDSFVTRMSFEEYMQMFASKLSTTSLTWRRPNRRFSDVYLPSDHGDRVGTLVFGIDTSGSIDDHELAKFQSAARRLQEDLKPSKVVVLYADDAVCGEPEVFEGADPVTFNRPRGGGGTSFAPVFAKVQEMRDVEGEEVVGVIYLTDLEGDFPDEQAQLEAPPTLWVCTTNETAPFGEVAYFHG